MKFIRTFKLGVVALGIAASGLLTGQSAMALSVKAEIFQTSESPWDMAFLQDGTMFFSEKCKGLSVRMTSGKVNPLLGVGGSKGFSAVKEDLFCDGQAGVQGVAIDPEFSKNGFVYLYSSSKVANRTYGGYNNIVMRMKVNSTFDGVSDITEIINDIGYKPLKSNHPFGGPGAHNGGRIRFNPADGYLYVTTGDNHNNLGPQSPTEIRGKVLRVDRDGKAAPGNTPPQALISVSLHTVSVIRRAFLSVQVQTIFTYLKTGPGTVMRLQKSSTAAMVAGIQEIT